MKHLKMRLLSVLASSLVVVLSAPSAMADDSEVFNSSTFTTGSDVLPNVLFVIDTSGSMDTEFTVYDPTYVYQGPCDANVIYWQHANNKRPPVCTETNQFFTKTANRCRAAYQGMAASGWYRGRTQQLDGIGNAARAWQNIVPGQPDRYVECAADRGNHGNFLGSQADTTTGGSAKKYARAGSGTGYANRWGVNGDGSNLSVNAWNGKENISYYDGNYANYFYGNEPGKRVSRHTIVRDVAKNLITSLEGVNLGLARYSNDQGSDYEETAEGGMITFPVSRLTTENRTAMRAQLDAQIPAGNTPLSETYFEAYKYLAGLSVGYGNTSKLNSTTPYPSVPSSRVGGTADSNTYESPMDFDCQDTFIVYLTDGLPTADDSASDDIIAMFGEADDDGTEEGGDLTTCPDTGPDGTVNGRCMVNLAQYMFRHDSRDGIDGVQNIRTFVIGFGDDIETSAAFLNEVAAAGGGTAYTATDAAGLTATLEEIFNAVASETNTSFVTPTVPVNAFNRARNLDSLFVSVFSPSSKLHWPGNLKKYKLSNNKIVDKNGDDAVDPDTGFFVESSEDIFSETTDDGVEVEKGGAANQIPSGDARKVYTYLGDSENLTDSGNAISTDNSEFMDSPEKLGLPAGSPDADITRLISYIRGVNTKADANSTAARGAMGDPMRTRPAVAIYGGEENDPTGTIYTTTNDGVLHAFDMTDGEELWSFIPEEFLPLQGELFTDPPTATRRYALDGDVRLYRRDDSVPRDGIPEKVYAIFGFGRGGSVYYALDVTSRETPKFLWKKTRTDLPRLGQAWSAPVITRVNVGGGGQTDDDKVVAIFGGGYDEAQENYEYERDGLGNSIYMVEVETGNLLWRAGGTGSGANFINANMNNAIPGDIAVLDIDGDGFADRMYAGDMGGRVWRFDIWHSQSPNNLVTGGVLATLGAGHVADPTLEETRRFYYMPDVSVVTPRGSAPFMNIAIGSGYRGHPLETDTQDRFYSVRDYRPFIRMLDTSYGDPIEDGDLVDVTLLDNEGNFVEVPDGSLGWKLLLNLDGWRGEKVLAESVTANGVIFFPTFTPNGRSEDEPCLPATLNRAYAVFLDNAKPFGLRDGENPGDPDEDPDPRDRFTDLEQGGIAPGVSIIQTPEETLCLDGVEALGRCVDIGDVVRTYWERRQ